MLDPRLKEVRDLLETIDPQDKEKRATIWREAYRRMVGYTLHGMHKIAWESGLSGLTGSEWLDEPDLERFGQGLNPEGDAAPAIGVSSTQFYRGYALHLSVRCEGASWGYTASVEGDSDRVLFETHGAGLQTLESAYEAGMAAAMSAVIGTTD